MRAPAFWETGEGPWPQVLAPLSLVTGLAGMVRRTLVRSAKLPVPVVCVGNLVAGGAGKTPVVLALLPLLRQFFREDAGAVQILSRGYGGRMRGPVPVDPQRHDARLVGDEPLLLARSAPTWVARDRLAGAEAAIGAGAKALLLDDGFQDPAVAKNLSLVVIDGGYGFGNGHLLPAGPLRERIASGMARADAIVLIGDDMRGIGEAVGGHLPMLHAAVCPGPEILSLPSARVFAFAGIGRPAKFFAMLEAAGLDVRGVRAFPDHHRYRPDEIMSICEAAAAGGAVPVTTQKDLVRLPAEARAMVHGVSMSLAWEDPAAVARCLGAVLDRGGAASRAASTDRSQSNVP